MKAKNLLLFSVFILVYVLGIIGCTPQNKDSNLPIEINIGENVSNFKKLQISDYFEDVTYIPLSSDSIILGSVRGVDIKNNLIAVSDGGKCLLFDHTGRFISKIGNSGRGPGEYTLIYSVNIGSDNNIFLQDFKTIFEYNLQGKFIRNFIPEIHKESFEVGTFKVYNDSLFIEHIPNITGNVAYKCAILDSDGNTINRFKNYTLLNRKNPRVSSDEMNAIIYEFNKKTYYKEVYNDTLYAINDKIQLEPVYEFNLGKYAQLLEDRETNADKMNYIFISNVVESKRYLFIDCNFGTNSPAKRPEPVMINGGISEYYTYQILAVYDKVSENVVFSKISDEDNQVVNTGFNNDFDSGLAFQPSIVINDTVFAMMVDAYVLNEYINSDAFKNASPKYPEKKKQLEQLANSLNENDNPVLMLVKLKN